MFSVRSLTSKAISAIRRTPSVAKSTSTPSVAISARYCAVSDASGSVRMRTKSPTLSESSSTRIGSRPCSSGIRSEGFDRLRSEEHTSELQSHSDLVCRLLLEKKKKKKKKKTHTTKKKQKL